MIETDINGYTSFSVYSNCVFRCGFSPIWMYDSGGLKDGGGNLYATQAGVAAQGYLSQLAGRNVSELTNDAEYVTGAYNPANPGYWAGSPPATVAEALDRLAAAVSNAGANPIP